MKWLEPEKFDWGEGPPLSSFRSVMIASICYVLAVILSTILSKTLLPIIPQSDKKNDDAPPATKKTDLKWRPWFHTDLKTAQLLHNIVLVLSSAIMLCGVIYESYRRMIGSSDGDRPPFLLCETTEGDSVARGSLYYWSYIYYLSKYYELLDTVLQLARGKPPPHFVLHVYHHACVLFMAWAWCETRQSLHFLGIAMNTAVHIVMYTYFLQRTITKTVPRWKKFVTLFQVIQFVISLICFVMTLFIVYVQKRECAGMKALFFNVIFNVTLLKEFTKIFKMSAGKKKPKVVKV